MQKFKKSYILFLLFYISSITIVLAMSLPISYTSVTPATYTLQVTSTPVFVDSPSSTVVSEQISTSTPSPQILNANVHIRENWLPIIVSSLVGILSGSGTALITNRLNIKRDKLKWDREYKKFEEQKTHELDLQEREHRARINEIVKKLELEEKKARTNRWTKGADTGTTSAYEYRKFIDEMKKVEQPIGKTMANW